METAYNSHRTFLDSLTTTGFVDEVSITLEPNSWFQHLELLFTGPSINVDGV